MKSTLKHNTKLYSAFLAVLLVCSLICAPMVSATDPTPTPTAQPMGGTPYITAYAVQTADGQELQKIDAGQKCQIVIAVCDPRFTDVGQMPRADGGNLANVKITSTTSFGSPSLGDIRTANEKNTPNGVTYAIVLNDITYLGGSNALGFDLSYNASLGVAMTSLSQNISQCSAAGTASSSIQPTVMVQSSSYGGSSVGAGESFTLDLTSYNTSSSAAISNIVTTLTLPDTLTLAGGSNSVMTANVAAGGSFTNQFQLMAQPGAATGIANITVQYTYYTASSETQLTSSQIITVSVVQPDRFSFSSMEVPSEMYTGEENTISLGFVNKGKGILYNLSAEISGNLSNPGQAQYLGNLQPGSEGSVDFVINSDTTGTVSGVITLTYEDLAGNQTTQTKEYSVTISEMPTYDDPGMMDDPGTMEEPVQAGLPWWGWLLIVVAVVVVIVIAIKVVKARKAKKEQLDLEDEDEDN